MTGIVRRTSMNQRRCVFALAAALVCSLPTTARAEVHVEGSPAAVRITTSRDTISNVLSALAATFKVQCRAATPHDAAAESTYSGSFGQVSSRLPGRYNKVKKADESKTTKIAVVSQS